MISEKVQVATTMRPKVAMLTSGMDRSVVAMKRGNARGARGAGHPLYDPFIVANRQRDEPLGCLGGRQPSSGGTSRMTGDRLVRICEGSRVKFLRSTRQSKPAAFFSTRAKVRKMSLQFKHTGASDGGDQATTAWRAEVAQDFGEF